MSAFNSAFRKGFVGRAIGILASASAVASAVDSHRRPNSRQLRQLGIDPAQFGRIRLD